MKVIRRVHLYLGLLLLPWVLLYGASALLFNHATWASERSTRALDADDLREAGWPAFEAAPGALATALEAGFAYPLDDAALDREPVHVRDPRVTGGFDIRFVDDEGSHRLWVYGAGEAAILSSRPEVSTEVSDLPFDDEVRVSAFDAYAAEARENVSASLRGLGFEARRVEVRRVPSLRFDVPRGDQLLRGEYAAGGALSVDDPSRLPLAGRVRDYLLDLHKSHGYGARGGASAAWAVVVDVMGVSMLLWGLTGLLMWWQLLRTRRWGLLCLGVSVASAGGLGVAMYQLFAS